MNIEYINTVLNYKCIVLIVLFLILILILNNVKKRISIGTGVDNRK